MQKYKSIYPTLLQAKSKWSKPKDPYAAPHLSWMRKATDFRHAGPKTKLIASIIAARMGIVRQKIKEGYDPEVEIIRTTIDTHNSMAVKMAQRHGQESQEAAFHRAHVNRMRKQLKDVHGLDEMMSVGSGAIAGMPTHDPPEFTPINKSQTMRRKTFAGRRVFVVDPDTYHKAYLGKRKYEHYEKYLQGSPHFEEIREYGRKNWAEPIIIENEQTGAMVYLKYGSK